MNESINKKKQMQCLTLWELFVDFMGICVRYKGYVGYRLLGLCGLRGLLLCRILLEKRLPLMALLLEKVRKLSQIVLESGKPLWKHGTLECRALVIKLKCFQDVLDTSKHACHKVSKSNLVDVCIILTNRR